MIKFPENEPERVAEDLAEYAKYHETIEQFKAKHFSLLQIIELDAMLHPDVVYEQLVGMLKLRGFSSVHPWIAPIQLRQPEEGAKESMSEDQWMNHFASVDLDGNNPPRSLSQFDRYCPVAFYDTGELQDTTYQSAVEYKVN